MTEVFRAGQFEAARRALRASETAVCSQTKRALERLAWTYLMAACGNVGERADDGLVSRSPCALNTRTQPGGCWGTAPG